ncbi:hypothetical protein BHM03_00036076 [Ensete ventricosum]|nr:hypothetical protein BHM03_00036076 [Ensete ventricosum]
MGRGQHIGATRERALGPTSGWWAMKRRRAIAVLQEGSGSSGWKSHRKHRRLEERAATVADEGYDCGCSERRKGDGRDGWLMSAGEEEHGSTVGNDGRGGRLLRQGRKKGAAYEHWRGGAWAGRGSGCCGNQVKSKEGGATGSIVKEEGRKGDN